MAIGDRFVALQDFESEETRSGYYKGGGYTVQTEALQKLVDQWVKDGKVEMVKDPSLQGQVEAKGEVK